VLLSVLPVACVLPPVLPGESTLAMSFVVQKATAVFPAVGPFQVPFSVHFVPNPLPDVRLSVSPAVVSVAVNFVFAEFAVVERAVREFQHAPTFLVAVRELPLVLRPVWPNFLPVPMLFVKFPLALVNSSVGVSVSTDSMSLVVLPLARVDISISVN
jgi:hypothetical protein